MKNKYTKKELINLREKSYKYIECCATCTHCEEEILLTNTLYYCCLVYDKIEEATTHDATLTEPVGKCCFYEEEGLIKYES